VDADANEALELAVVGAQPPPRPPWGGLPAPDARVVVGAAHPGAGAQVGAHVVVSGATECSQGSDTYSRSPRTAATGSSARTARDRGARRAAAEEQQLRQRLLPAADAPGRGRRRQGAAQIRHTDPPTPAPGKRRLP
jgi:hypothetical protein